MEIRSTQVKAKRYPHECMHEQSKSCFLRENIDQASPKSPYYWKQINWQRNPPSLPEILLTNGTEIADTSISWEDDSTQHSLLLLESKAFLND